MCIFRISIVWLLLFLLPAKISSADKSPRVQRAEYLLYIINNIQWQNQETWDRFTIASLEQQPNIYAALDSLAKESKTKCGKEIEVIHVTEIEHLGDAQMVYLNAADGYDINRVLRHIQGQNCLLISENYEFQSSMINFLIVDNLLRFEININRLEAEGFTVERLFAAQAVRNKADWSMLYLQAESQLLKEQEIVEQQQQQILEQQQEIEEQQKLISRQHNTINQQIDQIDNQNIEIDKQTERLNLLAHHLELKQREIERTMAVLQQKNKNIEERTLELQQTETNLSLKIKEVEEKESIINTQDKQIYEQLREIEKHRIIIYMGSIIVLILLGLAYFIYRSYSIKKRANRILEKKNTHIKQQSLEIDKQRIIATEQRDTIAEQNKHIQDSITYASRIQEAVLPPREILSKNLKNYFLFNQPKDIVSGDYYWMAKKNNKLIIAVADCTGHGVPGAFMSMLGVAFLNEIVSNLRELKANEILDMLREYVISSLRQTGKEGEAVDGMDIALCILDKETNELQYSGANNPLYIVRPKENMHLDIGNDKTKLLLENDTHSLFKIKADIMPVGIHRRKDIPFTHHILQPAKNDIIYLFSDGFIDQLGWEGKRYGSAAFNQLLLNMQSCDMEEQCLLLKQENERWRKLNIDQGLPHEQLDDMLIMGVKI